MTCFFLNRLSYFSLSFNWLFRSKRVNAIMIRHKTSIKWVKRVVTGQYIYKIGRVRIGDFSIHFVNG